MVRTLKKFNIENFVQREEAISKKSNDVESVYLCPFCLGGDDKGHFYVNKRTLKFFCHKCNIGGGPRREMNKNVRIRPPAITRIEMPSAYKLLMPQSKDNYHKAIRNLTYVREFLRKRNLRWEDLQGIQMGIFESGQYKNHLVFPIMFNGQLVSYQCRRLFEEGPKYITPEGSGTIKQIFYNWDRASTHDEVVIVEGIFDAIRTGPRALATLGTFLSFYRINLLNALHPKKVIFMLDGDATLKAYNNSKKLFPTIRKLNVPLAKEKDPAEYTREALSLMIKEAKPFKLGQLIKA